MEIVHVDVVEPSCNWWFEASTEPVLIVLDYDLGYHVSEVEFQTPYLVVGRISSACKKGLNDFWYSMGMDCYAAKETNLSSKGADYQVDVGSIRKDRVLFGLLNDVQEEIACFDLAIVVLQAAYLFHYLLLAFVVSWS